MDKHIIIDEIITKIQNTTDKSKQKLIKKQNIELFKNLTPSDRVFLARHKNRPNIYEYIDNLFEDFTELCGDRYAYDDKSMLGGVAKFKEQSVIILGHIKGKTLEDNIKHNFGMSLPSGYRKAKRLAKLAQKFNLPIITFVDTPGAYPGIEAEKFGQGEAIASTIELFSDLKVPVISVIIGEGGSGGALAISTANTIIMLENAIYSILSPEGFATILWKDISRKDEACDALKLTSFDLEKYKICDFVIKEGDFSVICNKENVFKQLDYVISSEIKKYSKLTKNQIRDHRYQKFRNIGVFSEV